MSEETLGARMERLLRTLPPALRGMGFGDPDDVEYAHASDVVAWAIREIDGLREERRWVPVAERLPPVGPDEKVLVAWRYEDEPKESLVVSEAWHVRLGLFLDKEEFEFPGVKFWQPLPTGPEEERNG